MLEPVLRSNGYWYKQGTDANGKWVFESLRLPRGTSKQVAQEIVARENERILTAQVYGSKAALTFDDAALFYIEKKGADYFINDPNAARQIKILVKELGAKKVHEITGADLVEVCRKHYARCKPQSQKRFVYTWANAIIRLNAEAERCDLKVFKAPGVPKRKPVEPAPEEWLDRFVEAATTGTNRWGKPLRNGKRMAALALFLSFTGARISEAIRVTPEHIQRRSNGLWAYLGKTKNGKARFVKLHPVVVKAVSELETKPGESIFGFTSRNSVLDAIKRICERAGLPYYSTHKVGRHAFAKRMLDNGHTLMDVKDGGGWESLAVVSENYGHLEQSRVQDAVASVATTIRQAHYHKAEKV